MRLLNVSPGKNVFEEVFSKVMSSSVITSDEREQIRRVLLSGYLDNDEYAMMKTLVDHVSRGSIKFVE
ncbi:hypothetical protein AFK68_11145 [Hydrocoleum sp. CS-953]|uniref:hypothetical protein n=1 Tax=Hydrocoleum sp. CS-953 TaxID=1671698 RepID=UPI000B9C0BB0|nr:hypothetical protein [Hydrocoleum sp. CS-953]OZH54404.1 hypothetical protein AFK68_11145 [Hydrocoleum sp. CS-953]